MKIYFVETSATLIDRYASCGVKNYLISYAYDKEGNYIKKLKSMVPDASILLDSGAFTVFSKGIEIPLNEYIEFIVEFQDKVDYFFALDVINSGESSLENYKKMLENKKLDHTKLIPVFHRNDNEKILEYYCQHSNYIALGGNVGAGTIRQRTNYINRTIRNIPLGKKIHLLGVTSPNILYQIGKSVTSVDSSTASSKMGNTNKAFSLGGLPKINQAFKNSRVDPDRGYKLHIWNIRKMLQLEKEINEFNNIINN